MTVLARVLGRDLRCEGLTNAEARAQMETQMPAQYVDAFFRFFADGTLDESGVHPTVREVTGRPPRTFEQWAAAPTSIRPFRSSLIWWPNSLYE